MINFGMIFASIICFILAWGFGWLLQEAAYSHLWRTMLFALVMLIATLYLCSFIITSSTASVYLPCAISLLRKANKALKIYRRSSAVR